MNCPQHNLNQNLTYSADVAQYTLPFVMYWEFPGSLPGFRIFFESRSITFLLLIGC